MLSKAYTAGRALALSRLCFLKHAAAPSGPPPGWNPSDVVMEAAERYATPAAAAPQATSEVAEAIASKAPQTTEAMSSAGKGLMGFARKNPLLAGGLALGGAAGLGMGVHGLMTGKSVAPQPDVTYNYAGPANPML